MNKVIEFIRSFDIPNFKTVLYYLLIHLIASSNGKNYLLLSFNCGYNCLFVFYIIFCKF